MEVAVRASLLNILRLSLALALGFDYEVEVGDYLLCFTWCYFLASGIFITPHIIG